MIPFLIRRWFLVGLLIAISVGMSLHAWPVAQGISAWTGLRNLLVATVLFLMALPIEASAMWRAIRQPLAPGLATVINLGVIPPLAWLASHLLMDDLGLGLIVAGATPCTLASASVWTRRAGGNDAVSILVTIITNLACFLITPLWIVVLIGADQTTGSIEIAPMIVKLGAIVVGPMTLAQLLRLYRPLGQWATRRKPRLGILAQSGLLCMVWLGSIRTGMRLFGEHEQAFAIQELGLMLAAVLAVHLAAFWIGWQSSGLMGLKRPDRIAVGFAGSQKTLMVGLQVSMDLGVSILPMVSYHIGQLIADTFIADSMQNYDEPQAPNDD